MLAHCTNVAHVLSDDVQVWTSTFVLALSWMSYCNNESWNLYNINYQLLTNIRLYRILERALSNMNDWMSM